MNRIRRLWITLGLVLAGSFLLLGGFGREVYPGAPDWFARSVEFLQQPFMETLRWMRMVGDVVFLGGSLLVWFGVGLCAGWSYQPRVQSTRAPVPGRTPNRRALAAPF